MYRKFYYGDITKVIDDMFEGFNNFPTGASLSFHGQFVNTDDYDIVPRKSKLERDLKEKEQALQSFKEREKHHKHWAEEQEKTLSTEIDQLKRKLTP
jgi:hypothetical protein